MSTSGSTSGNDELEFEGVRSRLESGFYPTLVGPGPELILVLALAVSQPVLWLFPQPLTFLLLAIAFYLIPTVMALRARSRGERRDAAIVALAAAAIFVWAVALYFGFGSHDIVLSHAVLAAGATVIAAARYADCFRYAAALIAERTGDWREEDLANYAEFLMARRPGPGAKIIARQLYERAALEVLERNWPIQRQINIVERYAMMLEQGIGGRADHRDAEWWREKVDDLRWWTVVRGSASRADDAPSQADAGDGALVYHDLIPVWRARLDEGSKYEPGEVATLFHAFLLPESALIGCVVRVPGGDGVSTILHHVFDVSSPDTETYLSALEHRLSWRIELYRGDVPAADTSGPSPDLCVDIALDRSGLMEAIDSAMIHNNNLGPNINSRAALAFFLDTVEVHRDGDGIDAAWSEIDTVCLKVDDQGA
jgi:hypothetical protein